MDMATRDIGLMSSLGNVRILHYLPSAERSGGERAVLNLCKATRSLEPAVWFWRGGPIITEFERAGVPCLNSREVLGQPDVTRSRFSLLHIHCGAHDPIAHRAARRLRLPCLTTLHSNAVLPEINGPLVCVAPHSAAIQDPYNQLRVIPNGIDTEEFAPGPCTSPERLVILRVCRPERCAPYFLDAMRRVLDRHPHAELWIAGEEGSAGTRIRFLGTRSDVPDLLRQAGIFAYAPVPGGGAHDLSVLEAMSAGVPPVVTNVECVRGSVTHMHDGILAPFAEPEAFARAVGQLITDTALRSSLARNARISAEKRFSLARLREDYCAAYEDALRFTPDKDAAVRQTVRSFVVARVRRERFEKNLILLHDILARTAMHERYWVIGGLLLGWAREGRVLLHDSNDADFGFFEQDRDTFLEALPTLLANGFEPFARYVDNRGIAVEYSFRKDGARFDFFQHEQVDENLRYTYFSASPTEDRRPIELIGQVPRYQLGLMDFLGRTWLKPEDHESFLTAEYGDWRTSNPRFDHRRDSPSVTQIHWWSNASDSSFVSAWPASKNGRERLI